jgi:hypothetical protein
MTSQLQIVAFPEHFNMVINMEHLIPHDSPARPNPQPACPVSFYKILPGCQLLATARAALWAAWLEAWNCSFSVLPSCGDNNRPYRGQASRGVS